ncbi:carboxy terminal-processing peptidase [Mucilaginibacter paludis]|uniref:Carboxyl-terminal protease n=1 Tax=Mucilaginibacter paludis DSM 18603 TaxID=714943 RepID=H1YGB3_9SPHI|nr:carboxy terminal-processing peptidase [Mucilaginibacter paludis]EHQ27377.1 carboxyl-terminal protease [Mucilaginibacter paludis DSM 18603]
MPGYKIDLNSVKDMFKKVYLFMLLGAALACKAAPSHPVKVPGSNDLQPDEKQMIVSRYIAQMITTQNYKKVELNDSLSLVIYNKYLKMLDENHNYLLASDVQSFEQFKTKLDDDMKTGDLNDVFYIFNVYQKRYVERVKYSLTQIDNNFDFTKNEVFTFDRETLPFEKSEADINELWTKRVKYDLLNLKLASPDMAKNRETLRKRYQNLLSQSNKLTNQDVFQTFMDAFTTSVDPHTNYFNPFNAAQFNMEMSRSLEGIGATLQSENEYVTIKTIVPGGPAYKSKLISAEDRIIGVAQGKDGEFQDIIGWRLDNAIALIRGPKGTVVKLKILSKASDKPKVIEIVREKIILQEQSAKKEIRTYNSNGRTIKIGIINIPAFYMDFAAYRAGDANYKSTTRDVKLILDTLKRMNVDGVVIDLRQNGGGSLPEAINLTGLFIKSGPVVQVRDTRNRVEVEEDEDPTVSYAGPLAVMVDRFSASASEIFSGAIQDYGRGLIIGSQTYGKGSVQSEIELDRVIPTSIKDKILSLVSQTPAKAPAGNVSTFGQINLTMAKFYRINGSSTQHKGVTPDIKFPSLIPMDKYGEDTEPSAMPWDTIAKSNYTKAGSFTAVLPTLIKLHDDRAANSPGFKYQLKVIADYKKRDAEKEVTLNEQALKKQRDEDEAKALEESNTARAALGLPVLKKGQAKPKNEDLDFNKIEAGQILTDYILMDNKLSSNKKAE